LKIFRGKLALLYISVLMSKRGFILCTFLLLILPFENRSQDVEVMLREAQQLESTYKENDALKKYLEILHYQSYNLSALCKTSELYSRLGKRQSTKDKQKEYYTTAKSYAQKALQANSNSSDANFVMAVAMGRMALISSGEEKINAVKEIKSYAEKCIHIDPNNFKGYHVLGKWHYEVSDLNGLEKWLVKVAYGTLPKASLDESIRFYEKSKQLNPNFVLNYLELAKAYHRKNNNKQAVALLEAMMKLPDATADDASIKTQGKKLLKEWK
jgi:tetratricopeptide (TPR) repeat protein